MNINEIPGVVSSLRKTFNSGRTRSIEWRHDQLRALSRFVRERQDQIFEALRADLGKAPMEALLAETAMIISESASARRSLKKWMKPERVGTPIITQPGKSYLVKEPLGVVLIIGAWNYPVQLTLAPLIGAIAGGNCALIKPSEIAANTSALLAEYLPQYLDSDAIQVVEGAVEETKAILEERFDHVFYTGNGNVGSIVMQAAAKHLSPVTLELGGKSPTIVDKDVDMEIACRRIAWGKWYNAGQTCVAPDYVLVHKDREEQLLEGLRKTVTEFYGENPQKSPDYPRIVNERHHERVSRFLNAGEVVCGGQTDAADRYIAPTVLRNVPKDAAVMEEEIFGPVLPVLGVANVDEAIEFVNSRPKPLALYVFTKNKDVERKVIDRTSSGGVTVNHIMMHVGNVNLPFGGVGPSGMGAYHGKHSFDTFTHKKPVLRKPFMLDVKLLYPPYSENAFKWLKRLI